ncbi:diphthamide synthesis protein [Candidatus Woesearchaeota archaeon]|nr:diphthamide synthesis protein [Candidatus Woesearchaeota archaeon]
MQYDLELDMAVQEIKKNQAKKVVIQLPDGLKPEAGKISKELENKTTAQISIWLDSCYGACDIPKLDTDLLIQWGHSEWKKNT